MIFEKLKSGRSILGQEIQAFKSHKKDKSYIYFCAGIHGDKVEGIYVLQGLYKWLSKVHDMQDLPIIIIPTLNIDGYETSTISNARNVDLAADFKNAFKVPMGEPQQETNFLLKLFSKYKPRKFINFDSGKPPCIQFSEGGKHLGSFISKFNFYDLQKIEEKNCFFSLSKYLMQKYSCPFIDIKYPRVIEDLSLNDIWEHNEKALQELISGDILKK